MKPLTLFINTQSQSTKFVDNVTSEYIDMELYNALVQLCPYEMHQYVISAQSSLLFIDTAHHYHAKSVIKIQNYIIKLIKKYNKLLVIQFTKDYVDGKLQPCLSAWYFVNDSKTFLISRHNLNNISKDLFNIDSSSAVVQYSISKVDNLLHYSYQAIYDLSMDQNSNFFKSLLDTKFLLKYNNEVLFPIHNNNMTIYIPFNLEYYNDSYNIKTGQIKIPTNKKQLSSYKQTIRKTLFHDKQLSKKDADNLVIFANNIGVDISSTIYNKSTKVTNHSISINTLDGISSGSYCIDILDKYSIINFIRDNFSKKRIITAYIHYDYNIYSVKEPVVIRLSVGRKYIHYSFKIRGVKLFMFRLSETKGHISMCYGFNNEGYKPHSKNRNTLGNYITSFGNISTLTMQLYSDICTEFMQNSTILYPKGNIKIPVCTFSMEDIPSTFLHSTETKRLPINMEMAIRCVLCYNVVEKSHYNYSPDTIKNGHIGCNNILDISNNAIDNTSTVKISSRDIAIELNKHSIDIDIENITKNGWGYNSYIYNKTNGQIIFKIPRSDILEIIEDSNELYFSQDNTHLMSYVLSVMPKLEKYFDSINAIPI